MKSYKYFSEANFIYNGDVSDPELEYNGKIYNYYDIEDTIWEDFKEHASDNNIEVNDANFETYCKENKDSIRGIFENAESKAIEE